MVQPEEEKAPERLHGTFNKRIYEKHGDRLFSRVCCTRTSGDGFNLKEERFRLDIRMKFCTVRVPPWKHSKFGWGSEQKEKKQCEHARTVEEQEIKLISHNQEQIPVLRGAAVCPAVQLTCQPSPSTS